jgi:hypothetical protein
LADRSTHQLSVAPGVPLSMELLEAERTALVVRKPIRLEADVH